MPEPTMAISASMLLDKGSPCRTAAVSIQSDVLLFGNDIHRPALRARL